MIDAGTGHRPEKLLIGSSNAYDPRVFQRVVDLARAVLERRRTTRVISGMALGWDTALATAAVQLGIPFDAYIPFEGQESRWPTPARRRYQELLARAARIVVVCPGGYSREKLQRRNERMVDDADHLLALWSGAPGGTRDCLVYAELRGRTHENLWRHWVRHAAAPSYPPVAA